MNQHNNKYIDKNNLDASMGKSSRNNKNEINDNRSMEFGIKLGQQIELEYSRVDSPSKHLNALLGMPNYNSKYNTRAKENRSPNLTSESIDELDSTDQPPSSTPYQSYFSQATSQSWSETLPVSPQRMPYQTDSFSAQSPDINVNGMAGSLDFLLFTDEKAPESKYNRTQDENVHNIWPNEQSAETLNLSSAFSAVDAPRNSAFDILDTASSYSDIQPQKGSSSMFHSFGNQSTDNNANSLRRSGESVWRPGGESGLSPAGPSGAEYNMQRSVPQSQQSRQGPTSALRTSWEVRAEEDERVGGVAQLGRDLSGVDLLSGEGARLRTSRDQGGFQPRQQQQQQPPMQHSTSNKAYNPQHDSHYHFQQQQQQQQQQQRIPPSHGRPNSGMQARPHPSIVDSAMGGGQSVQSGGPGPFLLRPNVDNYEYEPQIDPRSQQQGGFKRGSVGSAEFRSSGGRSAMGSSQQGGFLRYSNVQSSMESDGGHSLSASRNQFHSLDANSNHFYPSNHYHPSHSTNARSSRDARMTSAAGGGGVNPMLAVSLTGSTRQELVESPRGKAAYKEFYRTFRIKEKESVQAARSYAGEALKVVGDSVKWRVYLEMADLCRRYHLTQEARQCFALVCQSQPRAASGFLEWSKLEEDCGRMRDALNVLFLGLKVSPAHELLLARAIKLQERLHNYSEVRCTLGVSLGNETLDRAWKSVLEGALFEARVGNMAVAKQLLQFLMVQVPWYGPIYFEAFRLEEKEHNDLAALKIIRKGLEELPRYGPLWFGLLRIMERQDTAEERKAWVRGERPRLVNMCGEADEAIRLISRELTWKVHFEKAQAQERAAEVVAVGLHETSRRNSLKECRDKLLVDARTSLVRSILSCPENLRWKILLAGSRLELGVDKVETARTLLRRAFKEVPIKSRANVFLKCSRLEEFVGNLDVARLVLARARVEVRSEWKVFLETVLLEARAGHPEAAVTAARDAVEMHPGTGRLWAMYIQLLNRIETQPVTNEADSSFSESSEQVVLRAITEVPKSGEVWSERARCLLNPLRPHLFDLTEAQRALSFAAQFTPQYGDTFIEYARLEMLCQVLLPQVLGLLRLPVQDFLQRHLVADLDSDLVTLLLQVPAANEEDRWTVLQQNVGSAMDVPPKSFDRPNRRQAMQNILRLEHDFGNSPKDYATVALSNLQRRCVNADPNYGSVWFECRAQPYDVPSSILDIAIERLAVDVQRTERLYARAILHFVCRLVGEEVGGVESEELPLTSSETPSHLVADERQEQLQVRAAVRAALDPSAGEKDAPRLADLRLDVTLVRTLLDPDEWMPVSGRTTLQGQAFSVADFVTGLVDMNRDVFRCDLPEETRRKNLFGSDQIIS